MPNKMLIEAEEKLGLGPVAMAKAMGVDYDNVYKAWRSERYKLPAVAVRCLDLLLMYPRTAKKLSGN